MQIKKPFHSLSARIIRSSNLSACHQLRVLSTLSAFRIGQLLNSPVEKTTIDPVVCQRSLSSHLIDSFFLLPRVYALLLLFFDFPPLLSLSTVVLLLLTLSTYKFSAKALLSPLLRSNSGTS